MGISGLRPGLFAVPLLTGSLFIAGAISSGGASAAPTQCEAALAAFDKDVKAGTQTEAVNSFYAMLDEPGCTSRTAEEARARLVLFLIDYAGKHPAEAADTLKLAEHTVEVFGNWRVKARLADYYWDHRGQPDALAKAYFWYQRSVVDFGTAEPRPTDAEKKVVLDRVGAAGLLANNDQEGTRSIATTPPMRDIAGKLSGIYSNEFRTRTGAMVFKIPAAIQFFTNEAKPTPAGEQALSELAEAAKNVDAMDLIGHADPRTGQLGPRAGHKHNLDLSCERVRAVEAALKNQYHVTTRITTSCKGDTQEYDTSDLQNPATVSQDEKWQLDRRVEFTW